MLIEKARMIAEKYLQLLKPHCIRIEIASSIRREKKDIGDIELVCIPKEIQRSNFFGDIDPPELKEFQRDPEFVKLVNDFDRMKGNGEGKYCQIKLPEEINLDLFITTEQQWGVIFMIRTGSSFFSQRMVTEIKPHFKVEEGFLKKANGEIIPCYEEEDFFKYTGMEYINPVARIF